MNTSEVQRQLSAQPSPNDLANIRMQVIERRAVQRWNAAKQCFEWELVIWKTGEWEEF